MQPGPGLHERTQLPAQQAARPACHHGNQGGHPVEQNPGQALVNYVSKAPAQ